MDAPDNRINRREFLQKGAIVAAGSATLSSTAASYSRIAGANDRISLGHIGIGSRGSELDGIVGTLKDSKNATSVAFGSPDAALLLQLPIKSEVLKMAIINNIFFMIFILGDNYF